MIADDSAGAPGPSTVPEQITIPRTLPLLVLRDQVVFPLALIPMRLRRKNDIRLVDDAVMGEKMLGLITMRAGLDSSQQEIESPGQAQIYEVGCAARILQLQHLPDGAINVVVQVLSRFRVVGLKRRKPYLVAAVEPVKDIVPAKAKLEPLTAALKAQMTRLVELSPNIPEGAGAILENIEEPGFLADVVASNLALPIAEKQQILETFDVERRLERLTHLVGHELELMELSAKIQKDVKSSIDKTQREYYLRQQLKAIQEELGEGGEQRPELAEFREKVEAKGLPEDARKEAERELKRLGQMHEASTEYHVIITYLDWLVSLPWNETTEDRLDIAHAETVLNEDHYGLEKVKRRIIEYLAVRKLKPDAAGPILCFVGPPGVGKTSLGQSIARALGRKFARMSLGGMRDEAEIRGHRRTYVGAMPGRIIQQLSKVESKNPVFMLDELDKLGADFRGDPSSALLEVLDPAQNDSFTDLYLGVPFDLSKVMFIATANVLDTIPWALRDRMEIIQIPGYTAEEKLHIAQKYLIPRQLNAHGLSRRKLTITKAALRKIIADYTREAGVRNLEREIANVCRGCARHFAEGHGERITVSPAELRKYLGNEKYFGDVVERTRIPGVATGLAWTATGGDVLFIEATKMPGKGDLVLTGQLGDVMKESARAVLSYVRANAPRLGLEHTALNDIDLHIHVPAGAVPKDGPSAGVTMLTAVVSVLTAKCVNYRLAMTGEITLRGLVLPVGGVKEKVLAAARAGIREIILPDRCQHEIEDVPENTRKKTKFHFVKHMDEVLEIALGMKLKEPALPG